MNEPKLSDEQVFDCVWWWRKWLPERNGARCRVLARGSMNAAMIEFEDGTRVVSSRYAIRKVADGARGREQ